MPLNARRLPLLSHPHTRGFKRIHEDGDWPESLALELQNHPTQGYIDSERLEVWTLLKATSQYSLSHTQRRKKFVSMLSSASWTRCLLTVGGLAHHVCAYLPQEGGSFVAGNLSVAAPYGIPPVEFGNVTANNLDSLATFNITGYNVSVDDTTAPAVAPGWTISVGVTDDVSLINAANSSKFDIEATTLFIEPPGGNITLDPSWRICAVVFPGLANATAPSTPIDGTCNRVLSSGCIQAIQSGSTLMDSNGNCGNYALPSSCMEFFPTLSVNNTATAFGTLLSHSLLPPPGPKSQSCAAIIHT